MAAVAPENSTSGGATSGGATPEDVMAGSAMAGGAMPSNPISGNVMSGNVPSPRRHALRPIIIAQACAYFALLGTMLMSVAMGLPDIVVALVAVVVLMAYVVCWPFTPRVSSDNLAVTDSTGSNAVVKAAGSGVERGVTAVVALVSIVAGLVADRLPATAPAARRLSSAVGVSHGTGDGMGRWLVLSVVLVVMLIVFGFARQMAREDRSQLVLSLSYSQLSGVAAVALGGWVATAHNWRALMAGAEQRAVSWPWFAAVIVIVVALAALLTVMSWRWWRQCDVAPSDGRPWIGFAMLPVMLAGILPALAIVALTLL